MSQQSQPEQEDPTLSCSDFNNNDADAVVCDTNQQQHNDNNTINNQLIAEDRDEDVVEQEEINNTTTREEEDPINSSSSPIQYQATETSDKNTELKHNDLYVLIHGLHGNRKDFQFIAEKLKELYNADESSEHAIIIDCACNEGKTHDGIEMLGTNVLKEVLKILHERRISLSNEKKLKLSVIGHSLGGLIARYFVKLVYDLPNSEIEISKDDEFQKDRKYFVDYIFPHLIPCSFTTISTPHLGSRRPGGTYFKSAYRFAAHTFISLLGKTGKELKLDDGNSGGSSNIEESLLYRMSEPESDFVKVLKRFSHRTLISSCHLDSTVPFPSASIRSYNPYPIGAYANPSMKIGGISSSFLSSPEYITLLSEFFTSEGTKETTSISSETIDALKRASWKGTEEESFEGDLNDKSNNMYRDNHCEVEFNGTILKNLQSIQWRRIDLEFTVASRLQGREVHIVVVRKKRPISFGNSGEEMDGCGERCVNLVSTLSKFDSDNLKL